MKRILVSIAFTLSLTGCETIVDDVDLSKIAKITEKLVVNSFISPSDKIIYVKVSTSIPINKVKSGEFRKIYDENLGDSVITYVTPNVVKNAQVLLSDGTKTVTLAYDSKSEYYQIPATQFTILPNKKYTLVVKANGLEATSSTVIPEVCPAIENIESKAVNRSFFGSERSKGYEIRWEWKDPAKVENYYKVWGEMTYRERVPVDNSKDAALKEIESYSYFFWNGDEFRRRGNYYNDKNYDGTDFKTPLGEILKVQFNRSGAVKPEEIEGAKVRIQLSNISKEFYDYQVSLQDFFESSNNPFAEPRPVYSNINGGLGAFVGFTRREVILQLK